MRFCGECGTKIEDDGQEFCHECGSKLDMIDAILDSDNDTISNIDLKNVEKASKSNIVICILILAVVAIILVVLMNNKKDDNTDNEKTTDISNEDTLNTTESTTTEEVATEITTSEEETTEITTEEITTETTIEFPDDIVMGKSVNSYVIIPQINWDSPVANQFNEEVNVMFSTENILDYQEVSYEWHMTDGYLSIIIRSSYQTDDAYYNIYNINLNDDVMMTNEDIFVYYGISEDKFYEVAQITLGNECSNLYSSIDSSIYNDLYSNTYSYDNAKLAIPYIGEGGKLYICGNVYSPAGPLYHTYLLEVVEELH